MRAGMRAQLKGFPFKNASHVPGEAARLAAEAPMERTYRGNMHADAHVCTHKCRHGHTKLAEDHAHTCMIAHAHE